MPSRSKDAKPIPHHLQAESAIRSGGAHAVLWATAVIALAADLWTKHWAFASLGPTEERPGLLGLVIFQRSLNDGALFGMGKGLVPLFVVASIMAVAFILYFFACSHRRQRFLHLALGLILAGAMGNMFDRTAMRADRILVAYADGRVSQIIGSIVGDPEADPIQIASWPEAENPRSFSRDRLAEPPRNLGVVRDFIKFERVAGHELWPWVFNVADVLLVVGVGLLFIGFAVEHWASRRRAAANTEPRP